MSLLFTPFVFSQTKEEIKMQKKERRIQNRFIHPKSQYITVGAGFAFTSTPTIDPNKFLMRGLLMYNSGFYPIVTYERGIKNNFFAEVGYDFNRIGITLGRNFGEESSWVSTRMVDKTHFSHNLNFGGGYRVIGKNNFHFLNIHGGFYMGIASKSRKTVGDYVGTVTFTVWESEPELDYEIYRTITDYSQFSFGAYLGASVEFRVLKDVRIFVKYTQKFGIAPNFKGTYDFSSNLGLNETAKFSVGGGGGFLTAGLKIQLFRKRLK